jgi:type I restriction enzyme S subunit
MNKVILNDIIVSNVIGLVKGTKDQSPEYSHPYIKMNNLTKDGKLDLNQLVYVEATEEEIAKYTVTKGDLLFNTRNSAELVGKSCIYNADSDSLYNNNLLRIRFIDSVQSNYIQYQFYSAQVKSEIKKLTNSTTNVAAIYFKNLRNIELQCPPLPQQKKIAAILDAADAYRQKTKALIDKYNELTQSLFLDMFGDPVTNPKGWEVKPLSEVCLKITDGTHQGPKFIDEGVPFLLVSNIVNNQINFDVKKHISEEEYKVLTRTTAIEKGDILYTSVGSYGNPAIVLDSRKFCFQRHIAHLKPNHSVINVVFLHSMMSSPLVKRQADRYAIGVAQKTLNLKAIKAFIIFLPSLNLQNNFAERVQVIEAQKAQAEASLTKADNLFNSLLQKAFKGELV